jgi:hypothetical protein
MRPAAAAPSSKRHRGLMESAAMIRQPYIVGRVYDHVFFILSPLIALCVGAAAVAGGAYDLRMYSRGAAGALMQIALPTLLSSAFTHAHLVIVFFRSHLNREIFRRHPFRFVTVPIVLLAAALLSQWVFVALSVVVIWWDVYHSSLQTFGLGRLYDQRAGNNVTVGRRADYMLNLVLYVGPVLAGVNLAEHLKSFEKFEQVDAAFLSSFGTLVLSYQQPLRTAVLGLGALFLLVYLAYCVHLSRSGYRFPRPKLVLYLATGICSVLAWGFGSFGDAFLIMNFFHAWQYFALVWWSEKKRITTLFRSGPAVALLLFLLVAFTYGYWRASRPADIVLFLAVANVVSILHFWYDGFIWSVRKGDV